MILEKSKNHNPNYLATIVQIDNLSKHHNADKLKIARVGGERIIVGNNTKIGDYYVLFPVESVIDEKLLHNTNSYRDTSLNADKEKKGFFEKNGRVKSIKLRGEYSNGYLVPLREFAMVYDLNETLLKQRVGESFDTVNGRVIIKKYVVKKSNPTNTKKIRKIKNCESYILENTVTLHVDTKNYRYNYKTAINPNDIISISYKIHGTSFHISNTKTKKRLNIWQKIAKKLGFNINDTEYRIIYGSRRVIKNDNCKNNNGFYEKDIYKEIADKIGKMVPKGYQIYGEIFGYLPDTNIFIQKPYDYGNKEGEYDYIVYRVKKIDTESGKSIELSTPQIIEFCDYFGFNKPHYFYYGYAKDLYPQIPPNTPDWHDRFLEQLEKDYNEKDCFMCINKVPEEGVVIRKESMFNFEVYKLKSQRFLYAESKALDKGEVKFEN